MTPEEIKTIFDTSLHEHEAREQAQFEARTENIIKSFIYSHESGLHHRFVDSMIDEKRLREERKQKVLTQVWGWGIIVALSGIGTAVYKTFFRG